MDRFIKWFQAKFLGYNICECCNEWSRQKLKKEVVLYRTEAPILYKKSCTACQASCIMPSPALFRAASELGQSIDEAVSIMLDIQEEYKLYKKEEAANENKT